MMESLSDKLKALGFNLGAEHIHNPAPLPKERGNTGFPIEKVVEGEELTTPYGNAFIIQQSYPRNLYDHHDLIAPDHLSHPLLDWVNHHHAPNDQYLFLDTETSGLAGGTGTFAFLIGLGFFEETGFRLVQLFMRHPEEEICFLAALNQLIANTNVLVTYNGKSFDVPIINTRHKLHGLSAILTNDTHTHIDMLHMARKIWKTRLPSRTLGNLEKEILGIYRTDEEVPGSMIPELYFDYLSTEDARPLAGVLYHNAMDIISLALVFNHTNRILEDPIVSRVDTMDLASIARIYESQEKFDQALQMYEASIVQGLPLEIFIQTVLRYAHIYKQKQDWDKAVVLWQKAAAEKSFDAAIELAKYYEHIIKDIALAIYWTEQAMLINASIYNGKWAAKISNDDLRSRLARLQRKSIIKKDQISSSD